MTVHEMNAFGGKRRRILSVIIAIVLVCCLIFSACAEGSVNPEPDTAGEPTASAAPDSTDLEPETEPVETGAEAVDPKEDPTAFVNELLESMRADLYLAAWIMQNDSYSLCGEPSEGVDLDFTFEDGSTGMMFFAAYPKPYDSIDACMEVMHRVFTEEKCEDIKARYFTEGETLRFIDGKMYAPIGDGVSLQYLAPVGKGIYYNENQMAAKALIVGQTGINWNDVMTFMFKKEDGVWKIDSITTKFQFDENEQERDYAYPFSLESINAVIN